MGANAHAFFVAPAARVRFVFPERRIRCSGDRLPLPLFCGTGFQPVHRLPHHGLPTRATNIQPMLRWIASTVIDSAGHAGPFATRKALFMSSAICSNPSSI